jgi:hypothetical protein
MLDWEAPTGGYLLTACFASGRTAGLGMLEWLPTVGCAARTEYTVHPEPDHAPRPLVRTAHPTTVERSDTHPTWPKIISARGQPLR